MTDTLPPGPSLARWSWFFPLIVLAHLVEEYWGAIVHTSGVSTISLSPAEFLFLAGFGWGLILLGIFLAQKFNFLPTMMVILATVVLINGCSHTIASLVEAGYDPGLITGGLIFIPVGALIVFGLKKRMRSRRYWSAITIGVAIHAVISLIAFGGGRLFSAWASGSPK